MGLKKVGKKILWLDNIDVTSKIYFYIHILESSTTKKYIIFSNKYDDILGILYALHYGILKSTVYK